MVKNLIAKLNIFKRWLLINLDTVLFLLAILIVDINTYHFGTMIGNYVLSATLIIVSLILNKPTK
ncbi:hypothetical protein LBO01_27170 [Companilactobacillus paralimentarius]|uniref:Uncharacterized protein n=1 Tax=Companilactobacillus bobalius TaxID=2801451 RepID=A0A202F3E2_9LACO|nr:hypothetical protein LKACC16343_02764 [Companilactobacillus bobalius]GEO59588.1 hypothetical protein LBO01_27170 [Companilactobacillus paralimentarius]